MSGEQTVKFPDYVQLGGHKYKIRYPYSFKERNDICGQQDPTMCEFRLRDEDAGGNKRTASNIIQTFFHELLHGIDDVFCRSAIHDMGAKTSESVIDALADGLTQVFMDGRFPVLVEEDDALDGGLVPEKA